MAEPPDPLLGRVIDDRFVIRERLGGGGMGTVYRAYQRSTDRDVALKVINPQRAGDGSVVKRFMREARLASRLSHPNLVAVYDFGEDADGLLYIVMELLSGRALSTVLATEGAMPATRVLPIATQLFDAVQTAHELGVVHRDLKPSNVVFADGLGAPDLIKVLDFGLARMIGPEATQLTSIDKVVGTPRYIAPELIEGEPVDERADIYSLGVILYQMLAGRLPFGMGGVETVIGRQLNQRPEAMGQLVPPAVEHVVMRMLERDPNRRFLSAAQARESLQAACEVSEPLQRSARPTDPAAARQSSQPRPGRLRGAERPMAVSALASMSIAVAIAIFYPTSRPPVRASPKAPTTVPARKPADSARMPVSPATVTAVPETVRLRFTATPTAEVKISGKSLGRTPVDTTVTRGQDPITVVFSRTGRKTVRRSLVPDHDVSLDVRLPRAKPSSSRVLDDPPF